MNVRGCSDLPHRRLMGVAMPLFEIETESHIIITWAETEEGAREVATDAYPGDEIVRLTRRPRDSWVISKGTLGLNTRSFDPCVIARECLNRSAGDKVNAIRLYRMETGSDLEQARRAIESNMVLGW
jgi:sugar/nucleoside kinase (ribokinase family)